MRKTILREMEWEATHENLWERKRNQAKDQSRERGFNALMEGLGPGSHDRLLAAIDRMLELAEKKSLIMYKKEDGTYALTDPKEKP